MKRKSTEQFNPPTLKKAKPSKDKNGEGGSTGSSGSVIKMVDFIGTGEGSLRYERFIELQHQWEQKYGNVIVSSNPRERVLRATAQQEIAKRGFGPQAHPILGRLPRFSGVDPRLNQLPDKSPDAVNEYANRLTPRPGFNPKPIPGR